MAEIPNACGLCQLTLSHFPIIDQEKYFCCHGCQAVFHILAGKQLLDNYQDTPIFQQALKAGLISNPDLVEKIRKEKSQSELKELEKITFEINEMWCPSCAEVITLILLQQKGILHCIVDYATDLASVEFSPRHISKEKIDEIILSLGYKPQSLENARQKKVSLDLYLRCGIACFCALNGMMFAYPLYATYFEPLAFEDGKVFAWLTFFSSLPVITYCMSPIWRRFISSLKVGLVGMEALVVTGVTAAFGLSLYELMHNSNQVYFDSMNVIVAFVLIGKIIEAKAKFSAKDSLFRLTKSLPRRGRKRLSDGSVTYFPIKEILIGDAVVVHAGEKIILDGEVIEGSGLCNEALMTGESLPILKKIGSKVIGGAILQQGSLVFKVLTHVEESSLQKIIKTVEQDLGHKSHYIRAADPIVRWFVPIIFLIALVTIFLGWIFQDETVYIRAVSLLLIACPCAIGIAAPLAESNILHQLASYGVIVRNRGSLALLPHITTFVFDKTGTVTEGSFQVLQGFETMTCDEKALLKTLSKSSNHLVSRAIYQSLDEACIEGVFVEECIGQGMRARFANNWALLGNAQFLNQHGLQTEEVSHSTVYFTPDTKKTFSLQLNDQVRQEMPAVLNALRDAKIQTILLSGDSKIAVEAVAKHCGFNAFFSHVNPLQKREFIEGLRNEGKIVCMIGDGINDAPALTATHVGISVVSATDISIQVSDLLLTTEQLHILPKILKIAKKGQRILKQNLFWAFFYNIVGIGLALAGVLSPLFAAFAMTVSSLMVLFNSKRLKFC